MAKQWNVSEQSNQERKSCYPRVELLVPVYHPGEELARLLYRMAKQTYPLARVHLLITAGEDEYRRLVKQYGRIWEKAAAEEKREGEAEAGKPACGGRSDMVFTRIDPDRFDHGGTRHQGACGSQAELMLFMTQDALPADDRLVERLVEAMGSQGMGDSGGQAVVAAAYARQLPNETCSPMEREARRFNYPKEGRIKTKADLPVLGIKTYFCSNVCAIYRRDIYEELGGFIRHTIFNEDMIYAAAAIQAGYGIAYAADARVIHSHNYSARQQFHRNFDLAVSQADHPEIFRGVPSEGEGIRMVRQTARRLCSAGQWYLAPKLVWQSGWKYAGYILGKRYRRLPRRLVMKLTMNPRYWRTEAESAWNPGSKAQGGKEQDS